MSATVTLSTTTLNAAVTATDGQFQLTSTSAVSPGIFLYVDRELAQVMSLGLGTSVDVRRGQGGTASSAHGSLAPVTIGRGDQFYESDPVGMPPQATLVSPWINVLTGDVWTAQGDELGPGQSARYWAKNITTHSVGALGVLTETDASIVTQ